jgi:hypothetical protein
MDLRKRPIEGTLAPEQTLSIAGNVAFSSTAITLLTVTPDDADNVLVGGTAKLDGQLQVTLTGGPFTVGAQYTLLQANDGLNGTTFTDVSITFPPGINPQITYDTNHVYLVIAGWHANAYSDGHTDTYSEANSYTEVAPGFTSSPNSALANQLRV